MKVEYNLLNPINNAEWSGKNLISVYVTENFFLVDKKSLKVENVMDFSWSPTDPILALFVPELGVGAGNQPARLEFYNVDELETMATDEHFKATDKEWDPTGRRAATAVTSVHEMENGFNIWSFNGKLLYRIFPNMHLLSVEKQKCIN
ncbi:eukaryotic translation initiation factor 3 subunit B-like [Humulus lupulus]|uniref:eukaryotic translation initiation factor 3 subunit B-like n=1 Tax=Humulus lupulus TaxID=3486 RepID=UPI002B403FAA|nr:eukaryotic translation initiation factor 3 subunit B-like [Humulus lupulus]